MENARESPPLLDRLARKRFLTPLRGTLPLQSEPRQLATTVTFIRYFPLLGSTIQRTLG